MTTLLLTRPHNLRLSITKFSRTTKREAADFELSWRNNNWITLHRNIRWTNKRIHAYNKLQKSQSLMWILDGYRVNTAKILLKYVYVCDICDTNIMSLYIYRSIIVNCGDAKWFQTVSESTESKRKIIIFPGTGNHYTIALIQYGNLTLGNTLRLERFSGKCFIYYCNRAIQMRQHVHDRQSQ